MDLKTALHQTAAEFLAHAVLDLFPNSLLLGGKGTSRYFYYDFLFDFPFQKQTLSLIEESLIRLVKSPKEIKKREMLASNAAQLFASRGQNCLAEILENGSGLADICEIGAFLDYCPYPFSFKWPVPAHLKLFDFEKISFDGRSGLRIIGALSSDKNALKTLLKGPSPLSCGHARFAIEEKLFMPLEDGHWIWQPKGETLRQLLLQHWKKIVSSEKFNTVSTFCPGNHADPDSALLRLHQACSLKSGFNKLAEIAYFPRETNGAYPDGLLDTKGGFADRLTLFSTEENFLEACISSLHFILEMPRILGFEFQLTLGLSTAKKGRGAKVKEPKKQHVLQTVLEKSGLNYVVENDYRTESEAWIEVKLPDALGRLWSGPFMSVPTNAQVPHVSTLFWSVFGTMERFVGLMLERFAGNLPLWLAPEQVRLIPLSEEGRHYADRVHRLLADKGIRSAIDTRNADPKNADLGSRLYQAIVEKIPFAVIMGGREVQDETLVVRTFGSEHEERMNINALCERITTVNEESGL